MDKKSARRALAPTLREKQRHTWRIARLPLAPSHEGGLPAFRLDVLQSRSETPGKGQSILRNHDKTQINASIDASLSHPRASKCGRAANRWWLAFHRAHR